jgi:hypothetical protein
MAKKDSKDLKDSKTSKISSTNDFYDGVASANEGISRKDVRSLFIWYDLLGYALPFQLIFILVYALGSSSYAMTMFSVLFIFIVDSIIKNSLERDAKNFQKFYKYISLVKLWVIPLIIMGSVTTAALIVTTFGLI